MVKGGALFNSGSASFVNCSFVLNIATGGQGGQGGQGGDGIALYNEPSMGGWGGNGGHGGDGLGAALYCTGGTCRLTNCTVTLNSSLAGSAGWPGQGGWGQRVGYAGGPGPPGYAGVAGTAGDALMGAGLVLINTLLDSNNGGNGFAGITDAGHNLSSDSSCAFTNTGSLNSSDPNLLPLASNGGPTLTMAPLPRSPAIDAGDSAAAPATDQRGFARPFGPAADIGAFEYGSIISPLSIQRSTSSALDVSAQGIIGTTCVLMTSSNLAHWRPVATNQIGSDGMVVFHDTCTSTGFCRFYRLMLP